MKLLINYRHVLVFCGNILLSVICFSQAIRTAIVEDFKPSALNQPGKEFPQVNSEGRVRVQISAPEALKVQLDISAVKYDLVKDENGVWRGESAPQDEGFHYYQLWVDGAAVPDPGSLYFYGASRWGSGIEIPAKDQNPSLGAAPTTAEQPAISAQNAPAELARFQYKPPASKANAPVK